MSWFLASPRPGNATCCARLEFLKQRFDDFSRGRVGRDVESGWGRETSSYRRVCAVVVRVLQGGVRGSEGIQVRQYYLGHIIFATDRTGDLILRWYVMGEFRLWGLLGYKFHGGIYARESSRYQVAATEALITHRRGVAEFYHKAGQFTM